MLKKYIILVAIVSLCLIPSEVSAQPPCPDGTPQPCGSGPPNPPGFPIDGGIGILIAAGVAYGIKKIRD